MEFLLFRLVSPREAGTVPVVGVVAVVEAPVAAVLAVVDILVVSFSFYAKPPGSGLPLQPR